MKWNFRRTGGVIALITLLLAGFLIAKLYFSFAEVRDSATNSATTSPSPEATVPPDEPPAGAPDSDNPSGLLSPSPEESNGPTPEEIAAQERWEYEHGYRYSNRGDYINLSELELTQLADSGDIAALQFLAARDTLRDPNRAIELYEQAAVFGSTYSLIAIADLLRLHESQNTGLVGGGETHLGISALEYAFAAELRGNNTASGIKQAEIVSEYDFSDENIERACSQAKQLIAKLESERIRLTGRSFDNSESKFGTALSPAEKLCQ